MSNQIVDKLQNQFKQISNHIINQIDESSNGQIKDNYIVLPNPTNIFEWFFLIFGLKEEYEGGFYLGQLNYTLESADWPLKIMMITVNGRFEVGYAIGLNGAMLGSSCDSIWNVRAIVKTFVELFASD